MGKRVQYDWKELGFKSKEDHWRWKYNLDEQVKRCVGLANDWVIWLDQVRQLPPMRRIVTTLSDKPLRS
jgi:hypothetical protein